jgi:pilus assembly protein CpaF
MNRDAIFEVTLKKFLEPVMCFLSDSSVTEVMINGTDEIYVEREGKIEKTEAAFDDEDSLMGAARNIAQFTNKRITPVTSRFDSRLPDGSRVHVVMPRCSRQGLCISIRKFSRDTCTLERLVERGSLTAEAKEYLEMVVAMEKNLIVSGGTGSGKTSLLNAISTRIPPAQRVLVIEDSSELQLQQPHVLSFETVTADRHGNGAISIRDLFHSALRMRPDRIIIGECRGGEALDLIQAMTSGHGGSMSTLHANTPADALNRLETMTMMSGLEMPLNALRTQIASAIDVVVQLARLNDGRRVIAEISEVGDLSGQGQYQLNSIFSYAQKKGEAASTDSRLQWTGEKSYFGTDVLQKGLANELRLTKRIFI